jgi:hypothetical protein
VEALKYCHLQDFSFHAALGENKYPFSIEPIALIIPDAEIFVYGKEVIDFHIVDYEALSTLNISATQELSKKNRRVGS